MRSNSAFRLLAAALLACAGAPLTPAWADDGDMRVLSDEITEPGKFALELQLGRFGKPRSNAVEGAGRTLALAELSYGIAEHWEASLQLPAVRQNGATTLQGLNLEAQYVAPHDADDGPYWGIRVELGWGGEPGERRHGLSEYKPLVGWRSGAWHGVFNLGISVPLGGRDRHTELEPTLRIVRSLGDDHALGLEYSAAAGEESHSWAPRERRETLLAVWDARWLGVEWSLALGHGLNSRSDGMVGKLLVEFELGD